MLMATASYADEDKSKARILVTGQGAVDIAPDGHSFTDCHT